VVLLLVPIHHIHYILVNKCYIYIFRYTLAYVCKTNDTVLLYRYTRDDSAVYRFYSIGHEPKMALVVVSSSSSSLKNLKERSVSDDIKKCVY
jgi:hypothetical protein